MRGEKDAISAAWNATQAWSKEKGHPVSIESVSSVQLGTLALYVCGNLQCVEKCQGAGVALTEMPAMINQCLCFESMHKLLEKGVYSGCLCAETLCPPSSQGGRGLSVEVSISIMFDGQLVKEGAFNSVFFLENAYSLDEFKHKIDLSVREENSKVNTVFVKYLELSRGDFQLEVKVPDPLKCRSNSFQKQSFAEGDARDVFESPSLQWIHALNTYMNNRRGNQPYPTKLIYIMKTPKAPRKCMKLYLQCKRDYQRVPCLMVVK